MTEPTQSSAISPHIHGATLEHQAPHLFPDSFSSTSLRRYVESYPVYGLGPRGLVAVGADGPSELHPSMLTPTVPKAGEPPKSDEVRRGIITQLTALAKRSEIVMSV